ncbi:MAG TPA: polysaccharide export protein [Gammaproteobacteria bacterium]|nr:polysaccharide export protein [Gammaproteobacteria bacterium]
MLLKKPFPVALAFLLAAISGAPQIAIAAEQAEGRDYYRIQPGDILNVSVWKEEGMAQEVIVRPDGMISFPLAGETEAAGHSVGEVQELLTQRLAKYIPDPVVTVSMRALSGNRIYIIGKVNRPGDFPMTRLTDVMQALSMAGGTSTYAALNKIKILRRTNGVLKAIPFRYGEVEKGEDLEQNIILQAGDVVVVP